MNYIDLQAYQKEFHIAFRFLELSKKFFLDEKYSLILQIRKSSPPVCTHIDEANRKGIFTKQFGSKISTSDIENAEEQIVINDTLVFNHIDNQNYNRN